MRAMPRWLPLLMLASVVSAQDHAVPVPGTELTITAPAEWTVAKAVDGATLILRGATPADADLDDAGRERGRPSLAVSVVPLPSDATPAGMALDALQDLETLLTHFDPILDREYVQQIGGRSWYCRHYTFQIGQLEFEQELSITAAGKNVLFVTASCDRAHYAANRPAIDAMIGSMGGSRRPVIEGK